MKTDKWFYELFLSQPGMLAELVQGIEPQWQFTYSAPVIKEKELRLDGVFVPVSDDPMVPIVFAEAQMQTDEDFYGRFFASVFLYLRQYKVRRAWRGLLILPSRGLTLGGNIPYSLLLDQQVTQLYLGDLVAYSDLSPNLALLQLLVTNRERSASLGKALLQETKTPAEFDRRLSLIETILANRFPDLTKEMIVQILDLKKMDITQSRFYQEIIAEGRQEGHQEGRQEGLQEGLQEGRQEEALALVLRQLKRRLGELSNYQVERIRPLSVVQLEELGEALLDFSNVEDLEAFLRQLE
jgi:predicted transposase/invertase (TIGR01784 family)